MRFFACVAIALSATGIVVASGYVDPSYSDADLEALADLIDALDEFAFTTSLTNDTTTKTAEGYILLNSTTPTFTDINIRATASAAETLFVPDLELEVTQYINPIQPSSVTAAANGRKARRGLLERQPTQMTMDICPIPRTVTVIEWVDCAATPSLSCTSICPTHTTSECQSCRNGIQYIVATTTATATPPSPCSSSKRKCPTCPGGWEYIAIASPTPTCTTTKKTCPTCPGGYEYIILGTPTGNNYTKRPCPTCSGGYEFVIINNININLDLGQSSQNIPTPSSDELFQTTDFAYSITYLIRSKSVLIVSTEIPALADWVSQLTWPVEPSSTFSDDYEGPVIGVTSPTQTKNLVSTGPFLLRLTRSAHAGWRGRN
jgi:hypothetical protein